MSSPKKEGCCVCQYPSYYFLFNPCDKQQYGGLWKTTSQSPIQTPIFIRESGNRYLTP